MMGPAVSQCERKTGRRRADYLKAEMQEGCLLASSWLVLLYSIPAHVSFSAPFKCQVASSSNVPWRQNASHPPLPPQPRGWYDPCQSHPLLLKPCWHSLYSGVANQQASFSPHPTSSSAHLFPVCPTVGWLGFDVIPTNEQSESFCFQNWPSITSLFSCLTHFRVRRPS